ncbi:MAG: hypothetical protein QME81_03970 [bacterium]|nr:hypothetical protein [bacterium]
MTKKKLPEFKSEEDEIRFWETHDAFKTLGEEGWEVVEAGTTEVRSVFITKVDEKGIFLRLPSKFMAKIGAPKGRKVKSWTEGSRLVIEPV